MEMGLGMRGFLHSQFLLDEKEIHLRWFLSVRHLLQLLQLSATVTQDRAGIKVRIKNSKIPNLSMFDPRRLMLRSPWLSVILLDASLLHIMAVSLRHTPR